VTFHNRTLDCTWGIVTFVLAGAGNLSNSATSIARAFLIPLSGVRATVWLPHYVGVGHFVDQRHLLCKGNKAGATTGHNDRFPGATLHAVDARATFNGAVASIAQAAASTVFPISCPLLCPFAPPSFSCYSSSYSRHQIDININKSPEHQKRRAPFLDQHYTLSTLRYK
jgi:hypothetical protein